MTRAHLPFTVSPSFPSAWLGPGPGLPRRALHCALRRQHNATRQGVAAEGGRQRPGRAAAPGRARRGLLKAQRAGRGRGAAAPAGVCGWPCGAVQGGGEEASWWWCRGCCARSVDAVSGRSRPERQGLVRLCAIPPPHPRSHPSCPMTRDPARSSTAPPPPPQAPMVMTGPEDPAVVVATLRRNLDALQVGGRQGGWRAGAWFTGVCASVHTQWVACGAQA